ncbi:MAG: succinate:quinone oxidoreductase, membrane protein SdhC [Sodalis sp. Psp]|nr:succinate:quinone oxidoreductase, membrane protein SdhC [Sodalis sp. Psp]MCR3756950.1 succinate:quinone oxidoreductase, membrane protein SdhC [Sodalis sp. Ppy]
MGKILKKQRPKSPVNNLDLQTIRFPVTAIISILHRVSGVIMFAAVGIFLWVLGLSLSSPEGFVKASVIMDRIIVKFILWGIITILAYHTLGGIRHMLMDVGYLEETLEMGKITANAIFLLTILLSILVGVFIW